MSLVDFSQYAHDHAHLFVYVNALGETSGTLYGAFQESLQNFPPIHPHGSKDTLVFVRAVNRLPRWAKDGAGQLWQEFQPYKRVLGVLSVTQCHDKEDLDYTEHSFREVCNKYSGTLHGSRCVVYGSKAELGDAIQNKNDFTLIEFDNTHSFSDVDVNRFEVEKVVSKLAETIYDKLQQRIDDMNRKLEAGGGRMETLRSPADKRESEMEDEAKLNRTERAGRMHKHIADLNLLCGKLQPACDNFTEALLHLHDPLWRGSANEGLGATLVMKKKLDELLGQRTPPLLIQSNLIGGFLKVVSAKITGPRISLKPSNQEVPGRRRGSGDSTGTGSGGGVMTNGRPPASSSRPTKSLMNRDSLDSIEEVVTEDPELEQNDDGIIEGDGEDEDTRKLLQKDLVVDRFTRAELFYGKAGAAGGVPCIELLFKFARYLVSQQRHKAATEVLQRVYGKQCFIYEHDKTTLYESMADVFFSMGFKRKASLLLFYGSRKASEVANVMQDHYEAHNLLSKCLSGYKLEMSSNTVTKATTSVPSGWPLLQAVLLNDLVNLARKTDQDRLLIESSCMLLQNLHAHMEASNHKEVVQCLEAVTKTQPQFQHTTNGSSPHHSPQKTNQCRRLTRNLSADNLISPLPLTQFPQISTFRPKHFPPHLRPYKTFGASSKGPFIVSHLHGKKSQRPEILWVVNDSAEITMDITNPLNFELCVQNMALIWKGMKTESCSSSLSLPAREKQDCTLPALPLEAGELELIGYEHTVFGVRSKCEIKVAGNPIIRVIPPLPQLRLKIIRPFFIPHGDRDIGSADVSPFRRGEGMRSSVGPQVEIDMIDGENCQLEFQLNCQKKTNIDTLTLAVEYTTNEKNHKPEDFCLVTCPTVKEINSLLPIAKEEEKSFVVKISAIFPTYYRVKNDFVSTLSKQQLCAEQTDNITTTTGSSSNMSKKKLTFIKRSRTGPGNSPPNSSSPVSRRPIADKAAERHAIHRHNLDSSLPTSPTTPTLVDSLNIEVPHDIKITSSLSSLSSLPSSSSGLHTTVLHSVSPILSKRDMASRGLVRTGSTKSSSPSKKPDVWDFNQFMDKRVSIRSDPGERKREGSGLLNRSPRSSGMSTPQQKSPTLASRSSDGEFSPSKTGKDGPVFTYDTTNSPQSSRGSYPLPKSPLRTPLRKGVTGIKKNTISLPSHVRHNIMSIPEKVSVMSRFTLSYSGGEGRKAGYHRRMESSVHITIRPSLCFENFNIASVIGRQHSFALSFYMHNKSGHAMVVTCSCKNEDGSHGQPYERKLLPKQKEKMEMILDRFNLPQAQSSNEELNIAQRYSEEMAKMVTVRWKLAGEGGRNGVGTLAGMRVPSSLLHLIQPVPLLMDVTVNEKAFEMDSESTEEFCVGAPVNISLTLINNTGCCIHSTWLLVDVCEFFGQQITHDLTGRMVHSGNLLQKIPQLEAGATYTHKLTLIFFYKSSYQVDCKAYITSMNKRTSTKHTKHSNTEQQDEETDGEVIQTYIEERMTSPILRGSTSPPPSADSLSDMNSFGGVFLTPVKITPRPLKCQLKPDLINKSAENDSPPPKSRERLLTISQLAKNDRGYTSLDYTTLPRYKHPWIKDKQTTLPEGRHFQWTTSTCRSEGSTKRRMLGGSAAAAGSMHTRLSHLCERVIAGPILSLQIVELPTSQGDTNP